MPGVPCSLVVTCWERADLLALLCAMFSCVFSLSHMVSHVRCGIQLSIGLTTIPNICLLFDFPETRSLLLYESY